MPIITTTPTWSPKCPNHGSTLEGIGFPLPQKGEGICPISGAHFSFETDVDETKVAKDKDGNPSKTADWKIEGTGEIKDI